MLKAPLTTLIVLVMLLQGLQSRAQGYIKYHNQCNSACALMEEGIYDLARDSLLAAVRSVDRPLAIDLFNLAKCYSQLGLPDSTWHFLEQALKQRNQIKGLVRNHHLYFEPMLGMDTFLKVIDEKQVYVQKPEPEPWQVELADTLSHWYDKDFRIRSFYFDTVRVLSPNDTVLRMVFRDSMDHNGLLVMQKIEGLMDSLGAWPGYRFNGMNQIPEILLRRAPTEWLVRMEKRLIEEIDRGNLLPWDLLFVRDRIRRGNGLEMLHVKYYERGYEPNAAALRDARSFGAPLGAAYRVRRAYDIE